MFRKFPPNVAETPVARPAARRKKDGASRPWAIRRWKLAPGRNCLEFSAPLAAGPSAGCRLSSTLFPPDTVKTTQVKQCRASFEHPPRTLEAQANVSSASLSRLRPRTRRLLHRLVPRTIFRRRKVDLARRVRLPSLRPHWPRFAALCTWSRRCGETPWSGFPRLRSICPRRLRLELAALLPTLPHRLSRLLQPAFRGFP